MTDFFAPVCAKSEDRESEVEKIAATQPMCEDVTPVSQGADDDQSAEVQKPKRQRKSVGKKADAESGATPEQSNNNDEDKSQRADAENPEKETKADTKEDVKDDETKAKRPKGKTKPKAVGRPINMDGFEQVAELADPPVKLVIGLVDGNDTLCMISDSAP